MHLTKPAFSMRSWSVFWLETVGYVPSAHPRVYHHYHRVNGLLMAPSQVRQLGQIYKAGGGAVDGPMVETWEGIWRRTQGAPIQPVGASRSWLPQRQNRRKRPGSLMQELGGAGLGLGVPGTCLSLSSAA